MRLSEDLELVKVADRLLRRAPPGLVENPDLPQIKVEECLLPFRNSTGEQCIELKIENLRLQIIFRSQVQSQLLQFPLVLRNRKPGDRIGTTTKLKDVLIADRVPVEIREKLLLVSDATGQVIYVSGMPRINCRIQKRGFPEVEIHILD